MCVEECWTLQQKSDLIVILLTRPALHIHVKHSIYYTDSNAENQVMAFPEGSRVISTEMVDALTGEQQTVIIIQSAQGAEVQGSMQGVSITPQTPGS